MKKENIKIKKSEFKKLYDLACTDWKPKLDEKLKPFIFEESIEFEEGFVEEMKKACTKEQLVVFNQIFKGLLKENLIDRINSYSDICKELNVEKIEYNQYGLSNKQVAINRILQAEKLFFDIWKKDWLNKDQPKYYPYFERKSSGWVVYGVYCRCYCSDGVVAYYPTEEIARKIGNILLKEYAILAEE